MRGEFWHGLMKGDVEAGKLLCRRENGLRRGDEREGLRNVQGRKVGGCAQSLQDRRRDELVSPKIGPSVHNAMAYSGWGRVKLLLNDRSEGGQSIPLRLVNSFALQKRFSVGGGKLQRAIVAPDAIRAAGQDRVLVDCTALVHAEFERRRSAIDCEDQALFDGRFFYHA